MNTPKTSRNDSAGTPLIRFLIARADLTLERLVVIPKPRELRPIVIRDVAYLRH